MKAISMFKLQSLVVVVLCTSQFAFAQTRNHDTAISGTCDTRSGCGACARARPLLPAPTTTATEETPATTTPAAPTTGTSNGLSTITILQTDYQSLLEQAKSQGDPCQQQNESVSTKAQAINEMQNTALTKQQETQSAGLQAKQKAEQIVFQ